MAAKPGSAGLDQQQEAWDELREKLKIPVMVAFCLGCFALLLFLWTAFGGSLPLRAQPYQLKVHFPEATTLAQAADVRIAGVNIGKVQKMELEEGAKRTTVTLNIDPEHAPLPKDTRAILRQKTLLGETYVELTPGRPASGDIADGGTLADAQVEPTVELDEILRVFDPETRKAFRQWVKSSALTSRHGAGEDFNHALGSLARFAQDGSDVLGVLNDQSGAVRRLVRNTGVVFNALTARDGELRDLIVNSNETFEAIRSERDNLAETFRVFPTFLDESRLTVARLEEFSRDTRPLVRELRPVARQLTPTVRDVSALAPDLEDLFVRLRPVIRASRTGLPQAARFLRGAVPVLDALHVFLPELNPVLSFLNYDQQIVAHFLTDGAGATHYKLVDEGVGVPGYLLGQYGAINDKSLSLRTSLPEFDRGNAYEAPNSRERAMPLGMVESFTCPFGEQRDAVDEGPGGRELPPCFVQPPFLWDGNQFPRLTRGKAPVFRDPPAFDTRGSAPADPNRVRDGVTTGRR